MKTKKAPSKKTAADRNSDKKVAQRAKYAAQTRAKRAAKRAAKSGETPVVAPVETPSVPHFDATDDDFSAPVAAEATPSWEGAEKMIAAMPEDVATNPEVTEAVKRGRPRKERRPDLSLAQSLQLKKFFGALRTAKVVGAARQNLDEHLAFWSARETKFIGGVVYSQDARHAAAETGRLLLETGVLNDGTDVAVGQAIIDAATATGYTVERDEQGRRFLVGV